MEDETQKTLENKPEEKKVENKNSGLNTNVKVVLIVIGVLILLGVIWRIQAYMTYRSYKKQADTLQKTAEEYQKTYLKQMNDMSKQAMEQQKKAIDEMNKQMEEVK